MGMYDSFTLDCPVKCPTCGMVHEDSTFQTKDFSSILDTYHLPDVIPYEEDKEADIYFSCDGCDKFVVGTLTVRNGVSWKVLILGGPAVPESQLFMVTTERIKKIVNINKAYKDENFKLKAGLQALLLMYYRGEEINPEDLKRFETYLGSNVLEDKKHLLKHDYDQAPFRFSLMETDLKLLLDMLRGKDRNEKKD